MRQRPGVSTSWSENRRFGGRYQPLGRRERVFVERHRKPSPKGFFPPNIIVTTRCWHLSDQEAVALGPSAVRRRHCRRRLADRDDSTWREARTRLTLIVERPGSRRRTD